MRLSVKPIVLGLLLGLPAIPATAQLPDLGALSGALKGGGLPDIGSTGIGNAAGLLSYCLKNQLLGGGKTNGASTALSALAGKPGVAGSAPFNAGQAGTVVTGQGQKLPIGNLGDGLKSRLCAMVLQHAKALL